jgi:SOS response regulatory protein OraA/RecX
MESALRKKLLKRAGDLLARRSYSRGELRTKIAKSAGPEDVEGILNCLEALNLLNDADYAYNFACSRMRQQGWGPIKVRQSLGRRQVAPQVIEAAIDRARQNVGDEVFLRSYLDRRCRKIGLPTNRKGIERLISHLRRRGFADSTIYGTLRQVIAEASWECFETGE